MILSPAFGGSGKNDIVDFKSFRFEGVQSSYEVSGRAIRGRWGRYSYRLERSEPGRVPSVVTVIQRPPEPLVSVLVRSCRQNIYKVGREKSASQCNQLFETHAARRTCAITTRCEASETTNIVQSPKQKTELDSEVRR